MQSKSCLESEQDTQHQEEEGEREPKPAFSWRDFRRGLGGRAGLNQSICVGGQWPLQERQVWTLLLHPRNFPAGRNIPGRTGGRGLRWRDFIRSQIFAPKRKLL